MQRAIDLWQNCLEQSGNLLLLVEVQGGAGLSEGAITPKHREVKDVVLLHDTSWYTLTAYLAATLA
jgi:hypothetical protein